MPARHSFAYVRGERLSCCYPDLLLDELTPHDLLSDRVLYLDPGVHFHEVEILPALIDKIFDRPSILVANIFCQIDRGLPHPFPKLRGK